MTSVVRATATYMIGNGTLGESAVIPAEMVDGASGERDGYKFRVRAPDPVDFNDSKRDADSSKLWCSALIVDCERAGPPETLDGDEALAMTAAIASDVLTALVLNLPKLGFPGELPRRTDYAVFIDDQDAKLDWQELRDPYDVLVVAQQSLTMDEILAAASGTYKPSRAQLMGGEAHYQALFNRRASVVTAVVVAASACEVAAHECVRRLASGDLRKLIDELIPEGDQAVLSPTKIVQLVIPVLSGRKLSDEHSALWGEVRKLFRARDVGVHQGKLPAGTEALKLVVAARKFIQWIEDVQRTSSS